MTRILAGILFLLLLGAAIATVSLDIDPRFINLPDSVASQRSIADRTEAVFSGEPQEVPYWRNRVLVPYAMVGLARIAHTTDSKAYLLLRWMTASLAFAAFMALVSGATGLPCWGAAAAAVLLAVSLIPTFLHIYEIPSDFLDAAFFSWLTLAALRRRHLAFALILVPALLNRESAVFSVIVWWALHAFESRTPKGFVKESAWCCVLGIFSTAFVAWVRTANAVRHLGRTPTYQNLMEPGYFWAVNLAKLREYLSHPNFSHSYFFLPLYLVLIGLIAANEWASIPGWGRRLLFAAVAIFLVSIYSNNIDELRIFIPSLVLVTLVVAAIAQEKLGIGPDGSKPGARSA
jgi:hypothetical protein